MSSVLWIYLFLFLSNKKETTTTTTTKLLIYFCEDVAKAEIKCFLILNLRMRNLGSSAVMIYRQDYDLEMFSHNPTDGSFAPLAPQSSTYTMSEPAFPVVMSRISIATTHHQ